MKKAKSSRPSNTFIDFQEITDTLTKNEDVLKTIQDNYQHNMVRIGSKDKSPFTRTAHDIIDSYKKGNLKAGDYVFDRDVFSVLAGRLK